MSVLVEKRHVTSSDRQLLFRRDQYPTSSTPSTSTTFTTRGRRAGSVPIGMLRKQANGPSSPQPLPITYSRGEVTQRPCHDITLSLFLPFFSEFFTAPEIDVISKNAIIGIWHAIRCLPRYIHISLATPQFLRHRVAVCDGLTLHPGQMTH